jgi:hypothetical protein
MEEILEAFRDADPFKTWWPFVITGIVFVVATIKSYMGGQNCPSTNAISDLVVLITGADGGKLRLFPNKSIGHCGK